jgi:hypothetical protein
MTFVSFVARRLNKGAGIAGNKKPHRLATVGSENPVCESEPDCRAAKQQHVSRQSKSIGPNHGAERIDHVLTGQRHFPLRSQKARDLPPAHLANGAAARTSASAAAAHEYQPWIAAAFLLPNRCG